MQWTINSRGICLGKKTVLMVSFLFYYYSNLCKWEKNFVSAIYRLVACSRIPLKRLLLNQPARCKEPSASCALRRCHVALGCPVGRKKHSFAAIIILLLLLLLLRNYLAPHFNNDAVVGNEWRIWSGTIRRNRLRRGGGESNQYPRLTRLPGSTKYPGILIWSGIFLVCLTVSFSGGLCEP